MSSYTAQTRDGHKLGLWVIAVLHTIVAIVVLELLAPVLAGHDHGRRALYLVVAPYLAATAVLTALGSWILLIRIRVARIVVVGGAIVLALYSAADAIVSLPSVIDVLEENPDLAFSPRVLAWFLWVPCTVVWCVWLGRYLYTAPVEAYLLGSRRPE